MVLTSIILMAAVAAVIIVSSVVYATVVSVTTTSNQAQYGVSYDVTTTVLSATDKGLATVPTTTTASTLPCTWTSSGSCNQALTKGHFKYTVQLSINAAPASTTTYTVTTKWDQGSGQSTMGGSGLTVSVPTTVTAGQTMNFIFDTGGTSFTTPLAIDVTVG